MNDLMYKEAIKQIVKTVLCMDLEIPENIKLRKQIIEIAVAATEEESIKTWR